MNSALRYSASATIISQKRSWLFPNFFTNHVFPAVPFPFILFILISWTQHFLTQNQIGRFSNDGTCYTVMVAFLPSRECLPA